MVGEAKGCDHDAATATDPRCDSLRLALIQDVANVVSPNSTSSSSSPMSGTAEFRGAFSIGERHTSSATASSNYAVAPQEIMIGHRPAMRDAPMARESATMWCHICRHFLFSRNNSQTRLLSDNPAPRHEVVAIWLSRLETASSEPMRKKCERTKKDSVIKPNLHQQTTHHFDHDAHDATFPIVNQGKHSLL
jgi:hypothetical protein